MPLSPQFKKADIRTQSATIPDNAYLYAFFIIFIALSSKNQTTKNFIFCFSVSSLSNTFHTINSGGSYNSTVKQQVMKSLQIELSNLTVSVATLYHKVTIAIFKFVIVMAAICFLP